jgi:F0F1-type ATP synthase assembly protein I
MSFRSRAHQSGEIMASPNRTTDPGGTVKQIAVALELPFLVVGPVILAGAIGFFLDRWLHTKPFLMIILGIVGVGIGIYDALKAASTSEKP